MTILLVPFGVSDRYERLMGAPSPTGKYIVARLVFRVEASNGSHTSVSGKIAVRVATEKLARDFSARGDKSISVDGESSQGQTCAEGNVSAQAQRGRLGGGRDRPPLTARGTRPQQHREQSKQHRGQFESWGLREH